jgi:MFS family permease
MAVFASTYFIDGYALLISVGITARMLSGMGAACFVTSFYAYIPILYPNAIEKMIGISELTAGIGFLIGPIAGSFLYNLGGYLTPFLVFGGMTIVITPIIYGFIRTFTRTKVDDFETTKLPIKNHNIEEVPALLEKLNVEAGNSDNRQPRTAETQNIDERKAHYPQIQSDFQLIDESQNSLFKSSIK